MVNCQNYAIRHPEIVTRNSHDNADFLNHKDKARRDTAVKNFCAHMVIYKGFGLDKRKLKVIRMGNSGLKNN